MVTLPLLTPCTKPENASTVATALLPELHVPPRSPLVDNEVELPTLIVLAPAIVPALGATDTLMFLVSVTTPQLPPLVVQVSVILPLSVLAAV